MRRIRELYDDEDVGKTFSGSVPCEHRIEALKIVCDLGSDRY